MPTKGKMTQSKLDELKAAYDLWKPYAPDSQSAEELAAQFGISKQTLYHWRRKDWKMDGRDVMKGREKTGAAADDVLDPLEKANQRLCELTAENAALKARLRFFD